MYPEESVATAKHFLYLDGPPMSMDTPAMGLTRKPVGPPAFSPAGTASQVSKSPENTQSSRAAKESSST